MDTLSQDRLRVLIVDDQPNWLEALSDMLESASYEIETATSYDEAMDKLRQRAFHVVVTDQRLVDEEEANIEGILLLDEVAKFRDGTEAIVVTGYPTIEAVKKALRGRDAFDYILKRPEEGGPFNIREYREQVKKAAKKAMEARQKTITLDFSPSTLATDLAYDQITESLFPDGAGRAAAESVRKVMNRLFYPLQPLARKMGKVYPSEPDQMCEIFCWSRKRGQAVLVRIGREKSSLEIGQVKWVGENWYPVKKQMLFESAPVSGVSYVIDEITFKDFEAMLEEA